MTNLIATDLQGQEIDSPVVDLFELELPNGGILYFHPGLDSDLTDVQFRENVAPGYAIKTYDPFPMMIDGLDVASDGAINRPSFTVANIGSNFKGVLGEFKNKDLIGKRITRRQTLKKYLVGESPDLSSPPRELSKATYVIDRIASENNITITFEVSAIHDLEGITLPRRLMVGKFCSWMYQGYELYDKGGCFWRSDSKISTIKSDNTVLSHDNFYNANDEPLVAQSWLTANAVQYWNPTGGSYTQETYVEQASSGKYYQCQFAHTNSATETKSLTGIYWKEVHPFTDHAASTAYSVGDLVKASVTVNGSTLSTIWYCILAHNSGSGSTAIVPTLSSPFWRREELCGKTLNSCKCRFQANIIDPDDTTGSAPSSGKISEYSLPFGSFIGTDKY